MIASGPMPEGPLATPEVGSASWQALKALDLSTLDEALRRRLAELWARDALFEHASVASFSKFALHLMAVAAPPDLLDGAHRAAIDEVRHARLCFALASAYAGEPLGPGPLPLEGDILGKFDWPSIAEAAVHEGCVGETIASLEAATAAEQAGPDAVREALTVINEDEARHAELAWRFIKYSFDHGGPDVRAAIENAFRAALSAPPRPLPPADPLDPHLEANGRLGERRRAELWQEGLREVVRPAAEALLGHPLLADSPTPSRRPPDALPTPSRRRFPTTQRGHLVRSPGLSPARPQAAALVTPHRVHLLPLGPRGPTDRRGLRHHADSGPRPREGHGRGARRRPLCRQCRARRHQPLDTR